MPDDIQSVSTKRGRKTKKNKKTVRKILELVKMGYDPIIASARCGIGRSTYYDRKSKDNEFSDDIEWAQTIWLSYVEGSKNKQISSGNWKAIEKELKKMERYEQRKEQNDLSPEKKEKINLLLQNNG